MKSLPEFLRWTTLCLCAAVSAGCHSADPPAAAPKAVVMGVVEVGHGAAIGPLPAEIQPRYSTPTSFRVAGKILERKVRLGDCVRGGQVLALLDATDFDRNVEIAQAQAAAAQHRLAFAATQVERDRAQAAEALIAQAQLDQSEDAYASALAQQRQSGQQLELAHNQARYASLKAEHDGCITSEDAATGQNVGAGQAVYQLAWSGAMDAVTEVADRDVARIRTGAIARVTLPSLPGQQLNGVVREIAVAADPQSRTYRIKLGLPEHADVRLGMSAEVAFAPAAPAAAGTAIKIPATALFHKGPRPAVWVIDKGDVLGLREVTVARYEERSVILSAGLAPGERIVQQGVHAVSAGEKVRPVKAIDAPESGA
ncbi:efflux RND transporter periplasmic adaptor subunit [Xanthomonas bundabergensis]|uniref:efflux RND transporter periplasmic adaptor subunit n=1 Tax=Xanthomonas bundabergensis TaxID=3160842 RepID=UPI003513C5DD